MFRSMLAFVLLFVFSGVACGQYPFGLHSSRTNEGPLTNLGRYHGIGYGPGYHNSYSRPSAMRWFPRETGPKSYPKSSMELSRVPSSPSAGRLHQSPSTVNAPRWDPLR
jgi:hypothetical protein